MGPASVQEPQYSQLPQAVVGQDFLELFAGEVGLVAGKAEFGELDFGPRIGMVVGDFLPERQGGIGFAQGGERLRQRHLRVAVVVLGVFGDDPFQERAGFSGALLADPILS